MLCGDPDRSEGPLRGRGEAADRVEPCAGRGSRARLRRLGAALGRRDGAARPPAHARVRLRRDDGPGRQPVGARALGGRLERRLRRGARLEAGAGGDRHRHRRLAAYPLVRVRDVDDQADARARLAARDRPAGPDVRPPRARWPARCATASRCWRRWPAVEPPGRAPAASPIRRLPADRRPRPRRRRGVRACTRARFRPNVSSRRLRRPASTSSPSSSTSSSPRCSSTTAVSTTGVATTGSRTAPGSSTPSERAMTAEEYVAGQVRPRGGRRGLVRLARRAPDRRDRRADPPDRRARPRPGLRRGVQRPRRPLAHALLGLDGLPGRLAPVRRRQPKRAAGERLADRRARRRVGPARVGRGTPGRARYGVAVIDARCRHRDRRPRAHRADARRARPDAARVARSSRERTSRATSRCRRSTTWRRTTASGTSPPCCSPSTGSRGAGSRRSRTRRSSTRPHRTRT